MSGTFVLVGDVGGADPTVGTMYGVAGLLLVLYNESHSTMIMDASGARVRKHTHTLHTLTYYRNNLLTNMASGIKGYLRHRVSSVVAIERAVW